MAEIHPVTDTKRDNCCAVLKKYGRSRSNFYLNLTEFRAVLSSLFALVAERRVSSVVKIEPLGNTLSRNRAMSVAIFCCGYALHQIGENRAEKLERIY